MTIPWGAAWLLMAEFQPMPFKQARGCSAATCTNWLRTIRFFLMSTTRDFWTSPPCAVPVDAMFVPSYLGNDQGVGKGRTYPASGQWSCWSRSSLLWPPDWMTTETGELDRCLKDPVSYFSGSEQTVMSAEEPRALGAHSSSAFVLRRVSLDASEEFIIARTSGDTWLTLVIYSSFRCLISASFRLFLELMPCTPATWHTGHFDLSPFSPTSQSSPRSGSLFRSSSPSSVEEQLLESLFAPMSGCTGWTCMGISPSRWSLCSPSTGSRAKSWPDISPRRHLNNRLRPLSAVPDSPKASISNISVGRVRWPSRPNALRSETTNMANPGSSCAKSQSISRWYISSKVAPREEFHSLRGIPSNRLCHPSFYSLSFVVQFLLMCQIQ